LCREAGHFENLTKTPLIYNKLRKNWRGKQKSGGHDPLAPLRIATV